MKALEELANYINTNEDWPANVEEIIKANGWTSDTGSEYGICHNGNEYLELNEIEITTGMNGFPKHIHKGYIGFASIADAEKFAKENNGKVVELRRRDGWRFWESRGHAFDLFTIDANTYGDDYKTVKTVGDWEEDCYEFLSLMITDRAKINVLAEAIKDMQAVSEKIEELEENEAVLLCQGKFCDVIKTRAMSYSEDVWHYEIGVEL